MKNRTTQIIYGYWNDVRRGRLAPRRFDIEPARIAGILAETMILERCDDNTYRFRLSGTRIGEHFATEFRGHDFLAPWSQTDRAALSHLLGQIAGHGGAALLDFEAETSDGRGAEFEAILLPLFHNRDIVDRFLGSISCSRQPAWLGTEPLIRFRLVHSEILWPHGRPQQAPTVDPTLPPALGPLTTTSRLVRFDRRQFRVVDGGRAPDERGNG